MTTDPSLAILQDPVAQRLLHSDIPARLSYLWRDGTPRVVPMWFQWNGTSFVMGAPPNAPKIKVLSADTPVSLVIDDSHWPYQVLTVQGTATVDVLNESFPEYGAMATHYLGGDGGAAFMQARQETFGHLGWARITIHPSRVQLLDFGAGRFPGAWAAARTN